MKKYLFLSCILSIFFCVKSVAKPLIHKVDKTISSAKANLSEQADDSNALQSLLDAGGVVNLPSGRTFNITKTVYITQNATIINGNMCKILYKGNDAAIDFKSVNAKIYPVRVTMSDLSIEVYNDGAEGIRWKSSYSSLKNCGIVLKGNNQTGIELCGDASGTGSYYNLFENCFIQGGASKGKTNLYGWRFTWDKSMPSRCPNANTWIGGRVGQCDVGMYINGCGNVINHMTAEGTGIAFQFDNPDSKNGCIQNRVVMPFIEVCQTAFKYGANSVGCLATSPFITGVKTLNEDLGKRNQPFLNQ